MSCSEAGTGGAGDFDYDLPSELIAQEPAPARGDSRLLLVDRERGVRGETPFRRLGEELRSGDLLVINDSRVLPARLRCRRADTGGKVEILLVRPAGDAVPTGTDDDGPWLAMARPARRLQPGCGLLVSGAGGGEGRLVVVENRAEGFVVVRAEGETAPAVAERLGEPPLPPYIRRDGNAPPGAAARDRERYQTVYARDAGSVAAPTAGLHFEPGILADLADRGIATARITLHVGPGTFRPPTERQVRERRLHGEIFRCDAAVGRAVRRAREAGGRVVAVGTTSLRVLETVRRLRLEARDGDRAVWPEAAGGNAGAAPLFAGRAEREGDDWTVVGETRLFLRPPDEIEACDGLLTNFHLPESSLLMLVAAFTSDRVWREVYAHAVRERFRFYSYGDAMLVMPSPGKGRRSA